MTVRRADVSDAAAIGRVHVQVWRETYAALMDPAALERMDAERAGARWAELLAALGAGTRAVVAATDAGVVGFAVAGPPREESPVCDQELYAINLLASEHGSGAGGGLFDAAVVPGPCSLWVVEGNARAIAFYARRGFIPDGATTYEQDLAVTELRMVRPG